jgi:small subunit ribosomal protein S8
MSMQDPISDLLTRIRNAQMAGHETVTLPASKTKLAILKVLVSEGFVDNYEILEGAKPEILVSLKYFHGLPVIKEIDRVSRPGLRIYKKCSELPSVRGGLGISIISTNHGVISDRQARESGTGGEVLCTVF